MKRASHPFFLVGFYGKEDFFKHSRLGFFGRWALPLQCSFSVQLPSFSPADLTSSSPPEPGLPPLSSEPPGNFF